MIIDIENLGDSLKISHYNEDGDMEFLNLDIPKSQRFIWRKTSESDKSKDPVWRSWDGYPVKKSMGEKFDKYRIVEILESFDKNITKPLWETQVPKKYFVDIETEITDNRADSLDTTQAKNKILSIALS